MTTPVATAATPSEPRKGFWSRRVIGPIVNQLTQGVTPDRISFTLGISTVCSLFPFLGFTWLLNLIVGISLRLNQPIMQMFNQLLTPIHLSMILVYVRAGEWIWGAQTKPFSIVEMVRNFTDLSLGEFMHKFGWAGAHAFTAWALTAPLLFVVVYFPLRPLIQRLAQRTNEEMAP